MTSGFAWKAQDPWLLLFFSPGIFISVDNFKQKNGIFIAVVSRMPDELRVPLLYYLKWVTDRNTLLLNDIL